jgi:hypothetical protein
MYLLYAVLGANARGKLLEGATNFLAILSMHRCVKNPRGARKSAAGMVF